MFETISINNVYNFVNKMLLVLVKVFKLVKWQGHLFCYGFQLPKYKEEY